MGAAIIADDLTGACDTGVQFVRHGFSTTVCRRVDALESQTTDILVLNTNSRNASPQGVREKIERSCQLLKASGRRLLYQKIDSMLRGYLATQIDTAMRATGHSLALLAPSFPVMGRKLVGGWLKTRESSTTAVVHLPTVLREQGLKKVVHVDQQCVSRGKTAVLEQILKAYLTDVRVLVIDASCDNDLLVIAKAWEEMEPAPLLVGSGGFASQIASVHCKQQNTAAPGHSSSAYSEEGARCSSVILLIGSNHTNTLRQLDALLARSKPVVVPLDQSGANSMTLALQKSQDILVRVDLGNKGHQAVLREWPQLFEAYSPLGLFLSGGDTAELICDAFGVDAIELQGEILPGISWGWLKGGLTHGLAVGTKSGGFGDESVLVYAIDFFHGQNK